MHASKLNRPQVKMNHAIRPFASANIRVVLVEAVLLYLKNDWSFLRDTFEGTLKLFCCIYRRSFKVGKLSVLWHHAKVYRSRWRVFWYSAWHPLSFMMIYRPLAWLGLLYKLSFFKSKKSEWDWEIMAKNLIE